jgi:CDP-diacylglycerol--serine O-phosphatidyltransferase
MKIKNQIPNLITLSNLSLGCIGIWFTFHGELVNAAWCIGLALLADFMDGLVARILGVSSELGVQLDSLADVVSFGVLPGFLMFHLLESMEAPQGIAYSMLIIPLLSAYRLAKFNIDKRQAQGFIGLPTPSLALWMASFPLIRQYGPDWMLAYSESIWLIVSTAWLLSLLLVSELPLIALKFKTWSIRENKLRYALIFMGFCFIGIFKAGGIPLTLGAYILLSWVSVSIEKKGVEG